MPKLTVVGRTGTAKEFEGSPGASIMENIRDNGFEDLVGVCGGNCSCGTCHIYVGEQFGDRLPPISDDEDCMLASSEYRTPESRLACQVEFSAKLDGLYVRLAPEE
jgi:2Fe-2S ferredoxin